ncbi:hypothetical protein PGTUg99_030537 [Puccinia graminis f. sp. tritici]|uniref:Uncharacterized protein n=1 Tax=Puccinia graminis f. sp. tritici TaxID=56615 RepID=A0A5B0SKV7_PUCGR|nr:hypothetical protein PGTUg99_030537 [Puccinia graminis f. sp. tritici]
MVTGRLFDEFLCGFTGKKVNDLNLGSVADGIEQRFWDERQCLSKDFIQIKYTPDCSDAMDNLHSLSCPTQAYMYTMGRVFRKTPQQTDGFRPERPQLGCEASNGRSGGPGIIWTLQKASKGCLAGETIQRMVYSPVSIGHLIGSVRWTTRKPSIGHFSECPIDGFHPGPAVEKKGSIVEKLFKRWSMVEKRSKNAARASSDEFSQNQNSHDM